MKPADFSSAPRRARARGLDVLLVGLAAIAAAASVRASWTARSESVSVRAQLAEARSEVAAARQRLIELERTSARAGYALEAASWAAVPPARVLADLADLLPGDVRLDGLLLDYRGGLELELRVVARDAAAFDRVMDRFAASSRLRHVAAAAENREGEVRTTVSAHWAAP
jgi:hypothetical protein